jgi:hypothetical protein
MRDAVMRDKARTTPEEAADKINDAVEDLTLKVAGTAVERKRRARCSERQRASRAS